MSYLDADAQQEVRERLSRLAGPVNLVLFTARDDDGLSAEVAALLGEIAALGERVQVESHDLAGTAELAYRYGIERAPAIVPEGKRDYGIRYYGPPSGYEFDGFLDALVDVSRGDAEIAPELRVRLRPIDRHLLIRVFTTPTCPNCPAAVRAAQTLALVSDNVRAECIDATVFPELAERNQVNAVPKTVFSAAGAAGGAGEGEVELLGAAPLEVFIEHALEAWRKGR